ncbi:unnamed protein product [Caretta caretta]
MEGGAVPGLSVPVVHCASPAVSTPSSTSRPDLLAPLRREKAKKEGLKRSHEHCSRSLSRTAATRHVPSLSLARLGEDPAVPPPNAGDKAKWKSDAPGLLFPVTTEHLNSPPACASQPQQDALSSALRIPHRFCGQRDVPWILGWTELRVPTVYLDLLYPPLPRLLALRPPSLANVPILRS